MSTTDPRERGDERLPLRWAVIIATTVGVAIGAGLLASPEAGLGTAIAVLGLLAVIVGN